MAHYKQQPELARAMAGTVSEPPPAAEEIRQLAAWAAIGNVLLNLDETLMKP